VEYGEAITDVAARQALDAARELQRSHGERSLREVASEAIARILRLRHRRRRRSGAQVLAGSQGPHRRRRQAARSGADRPHREGALKWL
jgi:hypothetical protein